MMHEVPRPAVSLACLYLFVHTHTRDTSIQSNCRFRSVHFRSSVSCCELIYTTTVSCLC